MTDTTPLLTEEEILNLPEFAGRQELIDGELIELPPAKAPRRMVRRRGASVHMEANGDYVCELLGVTIGPADRTPEGKA